MIGIIDSYQRMESVSDNREMYEEINALVGSIAKALDLEAETVAGDLEAGRISISMDSDENGNPYLNVVRGDRTARIYKGAIQYDRPPGEDGGAG